jgi:Uma2 family endonuclease
MPVIITPYHGRVVIPGGINDLSTFREWVHFSSLPEKLPIHFLNGAVCLESSACESADNLAIRLEVDITLYGQAKAEKLGRYAKCGMLWSNDRAGFATISDGFFMSYRSFEEGRVLFSNGGNKEYRAREVIGSPDVVIEIVNNRSEEKDTVWAMDAYWEAGVQEYWLIDAREKQIRFDVYSHRPKRYFARRKSNGWVNSAVFKRSYRLRRGKSFHGFPNYQLDVQ